MLNFQATFFGRYSELNDITGLLCDPSCRLLTLLGPGGIGKTRLAVEIAHQQTDKFSDGVYWVDLQPGQTADFLASAVAGALSLSGHDDPRQQLLRFLQDRSVLLVLDNFEQLLDDAGLLSEILGQGPGVKLLVTSRAALHLQEEWLYPLSGLSYPRIEQEISTWREIEIFDAVQLLVERVRRVRPGFVARHEQAGLLRICRLVEGMPLALELAASWARSLDCDTIAAEIERNLAFLVSVLRNAPDRHRSMQAVFAHSWSLLSPGEQAVFQRMAVFRGGFRRKAAEGVTGATIPLLTALVDKSLLRWQASGRYQMHELLRQYAENRLNRSAQEAAETRRRHAIYYTDFLHQRSEAMLGRRQRESADEIDADLENIRIAWQWVVQQQMVEAIGQAIEPLAMYCHIKSRYLDAAKMFGDALEILEAADPAQQPVKALVLAEVGWIAIRLGQFEKAEQMFSACQNLYQRLDLRPLPGQGTDPLLGLSTLASIEGDYTRAEQLAERARQRAAAQNHTHNLQTANYQLASVAYAQGAYKEAQVYAQAAHAACEQTGDRWFMAYCLHELGRAARALGDYAAARRYFEAGYDLRAEFSDPEGMALALNNLGEIALRQQRVAEAQDQFERSAVIYRRINDRGGLATAYYGLGKTAVAQRDYQAAQERFGLALAIAAEIQFTPLLLCILAAAGEFLLQTGRVEVGLALLALVQDHAATEQETKILVQQQLHHCRATLSPSLFSAATQPRDWETAVAMAKAALAAAIPPQLERTPTLPASTSLVEPLTERELEVLHLIAQGIGNREIAERLSIVIGTVKAHNNSIYGKLGVKNRGQAVIRARELNLL